MPVGASPPALYQSKNIPRHLQMSVKEQTNSWLKTQHWGVHNHFLFHLFSPSPSDLHRSHQTPGDLYTIFALREKPWATVTFLLTSSVDVTQRLSLSRLISGLLLCWVEPSALWTLSFWNSATFSISSPIPATHPITPTVGIHPPALLCSPAL